jgi:penicillin-binding protein 1C
MRANRWCAARVTEWVAADAAALPCSWHHQSDEGTVVVWPAAYRQWAQEQSVPAVEHVKHHRTTASRSAASRRLVIANPPPGATYLIDPTLRSRYQTLALRASAEQSAGAIEWSVNGRRIGVSDPDKPMHWPLERGEHRIAAADAHGRTAETSIIVK